MRCLGPSISDAEAFEIVSEAAGTVSDELDISIRIGLDVAASQLWQEDGAFYHYREKNRTTEEQISYISELVDRYDLLYVEDPSREDFSGFSDLTAQ